VGDVHGEPTPVRLGRRGDGAAPTPDFDDGRALDGKAVYSGCYAPHGSLYFDQHGDVRACCQNITRSLGNVRLNSIREIWDGAATSRLRRAVERHDYTLGCDHCAWQDEQGSNLRFSRGYDHLHIDDRDPTWPRQMEFALSNTCNLQCTMCTGWNSSAIRAHREHLPPLPIPYNDRFFDELAEFLPHLDHVVILGGEPFVAKESLRLLDMIAELDEPPSVVVITNATQWTPRVRRIFERVPMAINFSLDGITPATFEAIRVGARFDEVMTTFGHYAEYARGNGCDVGVSFCLMTSNWHEFADLLLWGEDRQLDYVAVNVVTAPRANSLYRLDVAELTEVVDALRARDEEMSTRLRRHIGVWTNQLRALEQRLVEMAATGGAIASPSVPGAASWGAGSSAASVRAHAELASWAPDAPLVQIRADADHVITSVDGWREAGGPDGADLVGTPLPGALERIAGQHGAEFSPTPSLSDAANEFAFAGIRDGAIVATIRCFMFHDDADVVALLSSRTEPDAAQAGS